MTRLVYKRCLHPVQAGINANMPLKSEADSSTSASYILATTPSTELYEGPQWLQHALTLGAKLLRWPAHPAFHVPRQHHTYGKTMPSGLLRGAIPYRSDGNLCELANISRRITGQALKSWEFAYTVINLSP